MPAPGTHFYQHIFASVGRCCAFLLYGLRLHWFRVAACPQRRHSAGSGSTSVNRFIRGDFLGPFLSADRSRSVGSISFAPPLLLFLPQPIGFTGAVLSKTGREPGYKKTNQDSCFLHKYFAQHGQSLFGCFDGAHTATALTNISVLASPPNSLPPQPCPCAATHLSLHCVCSLVFLLVSPANQTGPLITHPPCPINLPQAMARTATGCPPSSKSRSPSFWLTNLPSPTPTPCPRCGPPSSRWTGRSGAVGRT